jgi:hypothetical protein
MSKKKVFSPRNLERWDQVYHTNNEKEEKESSFFRTFELIGDRFLGCRRKTRFSGVRPEFKRQNLIVKPNFLVFQHHVMGLRGEGRRGGVTLSGCLL